MVKQDKIEFWDVDAPTNPRTQQQVHIQKIRCFYQKNKVFFFFLKQNGPQTVQWDHDSTQKNKNKKAKT